MCKENWAGKLMRRCGWRTEERVELPERCVVCVAPHTSNWDFILGMLYKVSRKIEANFFMKKEWFRFPLGGLMRRLGGVAVDRSKNTSLTDQMAEEFGRHRTFRIAVTPEGTRKGNAEWKKGFYFIALKASVPIILAYIDYRRKVIGLGQSIVPSGDYDADITAIKEFYRGVTAKYPEKFMV